MTFRGIYDDINAQVATLSLSVPVRSWVQEEKPRNELHVLWSILQGQTTVMEVGGLTVGGDSPPDETLGILQFDVMLPSDWEPPSALDVVDAIRTHFRGAKSGAVSFETPTLSPMGREGSMLRYRLDIPWRAEEA